MATTTLLGAATFTTANGTKTVVATPAVGDLLVVHQFHSGNTTSTQPTDDNADGLGGAGNYALVQTLTVGGGDLLEVWVRNAAIGSATSTTFTSAPGTTTGGGLAVLKTTGMSKYGATAILQSANGSTGAGVAPSVALGAACLTSNPVAGVAINASNPPGQTVTSGFTALVSTAYNTPTRGMHIQSVDSGFTSSTLTWGGTSATATASVAYELDSSAAGGIVARGYHLRQAVNRASTY